MPATSPIKTRQTLMLQDTTIIRKRTLLTQRPCNSGILTVVLRGKNRVDRPYDNCKIYFLGSTILLNTILKVKTDLQCKH